MSSFEEAYPSSFDGSIDDKMPFINYNKHSFSAEDFILASTIDEMTKGSFGDNHNLLTYLGGGSYGRVYAAQCKNNNAEPFVVKFVHLNQANEIKSEVEIMNKVKSHPNIVEIVGDSCNKTYRQIFMTLDGAITFQNYIKNYPMICENAMRHFFRQMSNAVSFLHLNNIAHLDIKPNNIVVNNLLNVKIIDFGISKDLDIVGNGPFRECIGTRNFIAPEMLQKEPFCYPKSGDIWSLGVTLFKSFFGSFPYTYSEYTVVKNEEEGLTASQCSQELHDLLDNMLQLDVLKRFRISDVSNHIWLKETTQFDVEKYSVPKVEQDASFGQVIFHSEQSQDFMCFEEDGDDYDSLGSEGWNMPEDDDNMGSLGSDVWEMPSNELSEQHCDTSFKQDDIMNYRQQLFDNVMQEDLELSYQSPVIRKDKPSVISIEAFTEINLDEDTTTTMDEPTNTTTSKAVGHMMKAARIFITGAFTMYHGWW